MKTSRKEREKQDNVVFHHHNFENCTSFKYLGTMITNNNDISSEIRTRIMAGNRCLFGLGKILKLSSLSRFAKKIIYKTILRPVVTYASEAWVLTIKNENMLAVWERKVLRKIYGPYFYNGQFRSRTNKELMEIYGEPSIVSFIKKGRLRWLGHLERMPESSLPKRALYGHPGGTRKRGRPRLRWLQDVEDDLRRVGCRRWRQRAQDRDEWFQLIEEAQALHGL